MPYRYNFYINLKQDWFDILKGRLERLGYNITETGIEVSHIYFNFIKRRILPKPREIKISKEFKCPKKYEKGLSILKSKITKGEDLTPYLSKKILKVNYNDGLLNDWGIYHLHLGKEKKGDFIERTGPLLFVRVDEKNVYFINIYSHGCWSNKQIIKIIHNNWPESIEEFRFNYEKDTMIKFTDNDYKNMRKYNINVPVEIGNGVAYMPIGHGYTCSGMSTQIVLMCNRKIRKINAYEAYIKSHIGEIAKQIESINGFIPSKMHFRLWMEDENKKIFVYEINSNIKIRIC